MMQAFEAGLQDLCKTHDSTHARPDLHRFANDVLLLAEKTLMGGANAYRMFRYRTDEAFRRQCIDASVNAEKKRYHADPQYREKKKAQVRQQQKEKYATDPEFRARVLAAGKEYRERKKMTNASVQEKI